MTRFAILAALLIFVAPFSIHAQTPASSDSAAIRQAALDYAEGWYEGNADRMEKALHPDLAKRVVRHDKDRDILEHMGAMKLVQSTRAGHGKNTPKEKQQKDVMILDIFGSAASVKLVMAGWIDYLHVAKLNGRWVIANVLWELKPTIDK